VFFSDVKMNSSNIVNQHDLDFIIIIN